MAATVRVINGNVILGASNNGPADIGTEGTSYGKWAKTEDRRAMVMSWPTGDYS